MEVGDDRNQGENQEQREGNNGAEAGDAQGCLLDPDRPDGARHVVRGNSHLTRTRGELGW